MGSPPKIMTMSPQESDSFACTHDRLSGLPDQIIHHIFSFLGANETARISLVSKSFRRLCSSSPYLYFITDYDSDGARYAEFTKYVNNLLHTRQMEGIGMRRFRLHWLCKQTKYDVGAVVVNKWLDIATKDNVLEELDLLFRVNRWGGYSLPECVHHCQSLRSLKLNLQMEKFELRVLEMNWLKCLCLDSVTTEDTTFGMRISDRFKSLKRLILKNVHGINHGLKLDIKSLEELTLSECKFGRNSYFSVGQFGISSPSFKVLTITRCEFACQWRIHLDCNLPEKLAVHDSKFGNGFLFDLGCESLRNLEVCGSSFLEGCDLHICCQSVGNVKISSCWFANFCLLKLDSCSLVCLTLSECKVSAPEKGSRFSAMDDARLLFRLGLPKHIIVKTKNLQILTMQSSDAYSYEYPLAICGPDLRCLKWAGNPVDFSNLKQDMFASLEQAKINIKPSCRHKTEESARVCKRSKSLMYCVAALLHCLSQVRILNINTWPIEIFFMQNGSPVVFENLQQLILLVEGSVADQIPIMASFLKGLPNLKTLVIICEQESQELCDPNLIHLLGLNLRCFNQPTVKSNLKEARINLVTRQHRMMKDAAGRRSILGI